MGAFMSAFKTKEAASVVLELEDAPVTPAEAQLHDRVAAVLDGAPHILDSIRNYAGCQEAVQAAISEPSEANLEAAWAVLQPAIGRLREYYEYALSLEEAFPELMGRLCDGGVRLESQQALAKQLAKLMDFVIRFDHMKMNTPSIQNDFSYYRRSMQRMKYHNQDAGEGALNDEMANRMSLFYASHTPTMTVLLGAVTKYVNTPSNNLALDNVLSALSIMAQSTRDMVRQKHFSNEETNVFCLRAMTAAVILYDQLDAQGAFHKRSPINIRACVALLREWPDATERVSLANMMRFTSRHLKDETAMQGISEALDEAAKDDGGGGGNNNNA